MPPVLPGVTGNQGLSTALEFLLESMRKGDLGAESTLRKIIEETRGRTKLIGPPDIVREIGEIQDLLDVVQPLGQTATARAFSQEEELTILAAQQWQSITISKNNPTEDTDLFSNTMQGPAVVLGVQTVSSHYVASSLDGQFYLYATTPEAVTTTNRDEGAEAVWPSDQRTGLFTFNPNGMFIPIRRIIRLPKWRLHVRWKANTVTDGFIQFVPYWRNLF